MAMVYDTKRRRIVLASSHGIARDAPRTETWELEPAAGTWSKRASGGPSPRITFAMAFDSRRSAVVLFGGRDLVNPSDHADLWEWDGGAGHWIDRTPNPLPSEWPEPLEHHALAYSAARGRIVLFGGVPTSTDTWEWDGSGGTWHVTHGAQSATGFPSGRTGHRMTFDPLRQTVVLFGGRSQQGDELRDVWEWTTGGGTGAP
jgi:hypothetical protein